MGVTKGQQIQGRNIHRLIAFSEKQRLTVVFCLKQENALCCPGVSTLKLDINLHPLLFYPEEKKLYRSILQCDSRQERQSNPNTIVMVGNLNFFALILKQSTMPLFSFGIVLCRWLFLPSALFLEVFLVPFLSLASLPLKYYLLFILFICWLLLPTITLFRSSYCHLSGLLCLCCCGIIPYLLP